MTAITNRIQEVTKEVANAEEILRTLVWYNSSAKKTNSATNQYISGQQGIYDIVKHIDFDKFEFVSCDEIDAIKKGSYTDSSGLTWYPFVNTYNGNVSWTLTPGKSGSNVEAGTTYVKWKQISSHADGILTGPVTKTGLAMLHGSPSSPEYVLNSDQVYTLLKNLSTVGINPYNAPSVASYRNQQSNATTYQFGDIHLPNVQRPDQFFDELLRQANTQFGTIKSNYN